MAVIEEFNKFWLSIIGTRGATGKKTINASTQFGNLFWEGDDINGITQDADNELELEESKLEELENEQK